MARVLVAAALAWPVLLGSAGLTKETGRFASWSAAVHAVAAQVCHQRADRSFFSGGIQWPVCGRCSGLYLAAPAGALVALRAGRRKHRLANARALVAVASLPTLVTLAVEWAQLAPVSTLVRAMAAVPLGAAIAYVLVWVVAPAPETHRVH